MKQTKNKQKMQGFSLIELMIAMFVTLVLVGLASTLFGTALGVRSRESRKTDALTTARAAINVISREIANSGYGLTTNGIVTADSGEQKIHVRANLENENKCITEDGEDVTYYYDATSKSIVRYTKYSNVPCSTSSSNLVTETSVVVNRISNVKFKYFNYAGANSTPTESLTPTANTGRVQITVEVELEEVVGQPKNQKVTFTSDVTLRNAYYMLQQY